MQTALRSLLIGLAVSIASGCGAAPLEVAIAESTRAQVEGRSVGVGMITPHKMFRRGKRVSVLRAVLFISEPASIRRETVIQGDEIVIAGKTWHVSQIVLGDQATRGGVVLREPD